MLLPLFLWGDGMKELDGNTGRRYKHRAHIYISTFSVLVSIQRNHILSGFSMRTYNSSQTTNSPDQKSQCFWLRYLVCSKESINWNYFSLVLSKIFEILWINTFWFVNQGLTQRLEHAHRSTLCYRERTFRLWS